MKKDNTPRQREFPGGPPTAVRKGAAGAARAGLVMALLVVGTAADAQIPIIGQIIAKVVEAVDLKVQRLQTATIGLQEVEQEAENAMSSLRLGEIRDWVQQQKDLYENYFQELWKVKAVLADYHKVAEIVQRQKDMLAGYEQAMALFRQDPHFTAAELAQMETVYGRILDESARNLDRLGEVINAFTTQMTDQKRMEIIDGAADAMERDEQELNEFTNKNELLSLQRAGDENDYEFLKKIYGL